MVKSIFKGVLYAVSATLILVLAFAMIIQLTKMDAGAIKPVVQVVKVVCIFLGVAVALKNATKLGWLWGGVVGILYTIFAFLIFAIIDGNFVVDLRALNDLLFATAAGVISAFVIRMRGKEIEA